MKVVRCFLERVSVSPILSDESRSRDASQSNVVIMLFFEIEFIHTVTVYARLRFVLDALALVGRSQEILN